MSGHSKWANIKNKKAKTDAAKGKIFTKLGREIAVAAKGGADPSTNSKLADVIAKAKAANMPNDNIKRSIQKASGELNNVNYETLVYEGYGIGGSAVIVNTLTENKNRTVGEVRHIFDKYGGSMGTSGSVAFMFEKKGVIAISALDEWGDRVVEGDKLMEEALEAGAADFAEEGDVFEIYTEPDDLSAVAEDLTAKGYTFISSEVEKVPSSYVTLESEDDIKFMNLLLENLEENEDIVNVWHNWDEE